MEANIDNIFLENYQGIVDKLCEKYNLPHHDVYFSYRLKKVLGKVCATKTKTIINKEIKVAMSYKIILNLKFIALNHMNAILEVIIHELAHTKAGNENNHNVIFKKVCREMGNTDPMRISSFHTPIVNYIYECPVCKKTYPLPKKLGKAYSCKCAGDGKYNPAYRLVCVNKSIKSFLKLFKKYLKKKYNANLNEVFCITNVRNP